MEVLARAEADESRVLFLVPDFLSERAGRLPGEKVGSLDVGSGVVDDRQEPLSVVLRTLTLVVYVQRMP